MQCLISSWIIFKLQFLKNEKWSIFINNLFTHCYYNTFSEQNKCPSQQSGNRMKLLYQQDKVKSYSTASSAATVRFTPPVLHFLTSHSPALAWAVWHGMRLPTDTDPNTLFFLPLIFNNITLHLMCSFFFYVFFFVCFFGVDKNFNTDVRSVLEGNFNTRLAWLTVKY